MIGVSLFILASLVAAGAAKPGFILHEKIATAPMDFILHGLVHPDTLLDLRFALRQNNMAGLEKVLLDISSPESTRYGHHLSQQEVEAFVEPSADTVSKVNNWLSSEGLTATNVSHAGDWIQASIPAGMANNMFNADFKLFTHTESSQQVIRTLAYSIPAELQNHIDLVHPTVKYVDYITRSSPSLLT
jgi:tripeptidyl-peptidase-1